MFFGVLSLLQTECTYCHLSRREFRSQLEVPSFSLYSDHRRPPTKKLWICFLEKKADVTYLGQIKIFWHSQLLKVVDQLQFLSRLLVLEIISKRLAWDFFKCNWTHCGPRGLLNVGRDLGNVNILFLISRPAEWDEWKYIWSEEFWENTTFYYTLASGIA